MNEEKVLDSLLKLIADYYSIHRRTISLDRYKELDSLGYLEREGIKSTDTILRESLLEHVGSLPIVASYLYPHLEHKDAIDLGKVLTMLAIHDIGETVVGDEHPHQKTEEFATLEYQAALSLLPEEYHSLLGEYEDRETLDAKYAKAVDMFATFLVDQLLPQEFVKKRHIANKFTWKGFDERRYKTFEWDSFLKKMFALVDTRLKKVGS